MVRFKIVTDSFFLYESIGRHYLNWPSLFSSHIIGEYLRELVLPDVYIDSQAFTLREWNSDLFLGRCLSKEDSLFQLQLSAAVVA